MAERKKATFTVNALALRHALTTAQAFIDSYDPVPSLDGVNLRPHGDEIEVAATDRYTAYWEDLPATGKTFEALIPRAIVKRLLVMIPKPTRRILVSGKVTFTLDGEKVTARYVGEGDGIEAAITWTPPKKGKVGFPPVRTLGDTFDGAEPDGNVLHLNVTFIARVTKVLASRSHRYAPVEVTFLKPDKPVRLRTEDGKATALIMPIRRREDEGVAQ